MDRKPPLHPRDSLPGVVDTTSPPRSEPVNQGHLRVPPELTKSPDKNAVSAKANGNGKGPAAALRERSLRPIPKRRLKNTAPLKAAESKGLPQEIDSAVSASGVFVDSTAGKHLSDSSEGGESSDSERFEDSARQDRVEEPVAPARQDSVKPAPLDTSAQGDHNGNEKDSTQQPKPEHPPARVNSMPKSMVQDLEFPLPTAEEIKEFCLSTGGGYGEVDRNEFSVGGVQKQPGASTTRSLGRWFMRKVRAMSVSEKPSEPNLSKTRSAPLVPEELDVGVAVVRFQCCVPALPKKCTVAVLLTGVEPTVNISQKDPGALFWREIRRPNCPLRFPGARCTLAPDFTRGEGFGGSVGKEEEEGGQRRGKHQTKEEEEYKGSRVQVELKRERERGMWVQAEAEMGELSTEEPGRRDSRASTISSPSVARRSLSRTPSQRGGVFGRKSESPDGPGSPVRGGPQARPGSAGQDNGNHERESESMYMVQIAVQFDLEHQGQDPNDLYGGDGLLVNAGLEVKLRVECENRALVVHELFEQALWSRFLSGRPAPDELREVLVRRGKEVGGRGGRKSRSVMPYFDGEGDDDAGAAGDGMSWKGWGASSISGSGAPEVTGAQMAAFIKPAAKCKDAAFLEACFPQSPDRGTPKRRRDLCVGAGRLAFDAKFQQQPASYVRVSSGYKDDEKDASGSDVPVGAKRGFHHTNPHLLRFLAEHVWGLESPQLLITVTGGALDFQLSAKQKDDLMRGMTDATKTMRAWFIDGGTCAGIMRYMGEARAQYAINTPLIGVASWGAVKGRQVMLKPASRLGTAAHDKLMPENYGKAVKNFDKALEACKEGSSQGASLPNGLFWKVVKEGEEGKSNPKEEEDQKNLWKLLTKRRPVSLDHNHSHFILAHDGSTSGFGVEVRLRASFEAAIANGQNVTNHILAGLTEQGLGWQGMNIKAVERAGKRKTKPVPAVCVCVQGGPGTLNTVMYAALMGTPVLLVRGSGKAADLLADGTILVEKKKDPKDQRGLVGRGRVSAREHLFEVVIDKIEDGYGDKWWKPESLKQLEEDFAAKNPAEGTKDIEEAFRAVLVEYKLLDRKGRDDKVKEFLVCVLKAACSNRCWVYDLDSEDIEPQDLNGALLNCILGGANMKLQDRLRLSVKWKRDDVLKDLLHGPEIQENRGSNEKALRSALLLALKKDGWQVVRILIRYGVKLDDLDLSQLKLFTEDFEGWVNRAHSDLVVDRSPKLKKLIAEMQELKSNDASIGKDIEGGLNWRKLLVQCEKYQDSHHVIELRMQAKRNLMKSKHWQGDCYRKIMSILRLLKYLDFDSEDKVPANLKNMTRHLQARKSLLVLDRIYVDLLGPHFRYKTGMMTPEWDVFLWAVLMNRHKLATVLWEHTSMPTVSALTACILNRKMIETCKKVELTGRLEENALEFERMAVELMVNARTENMPLALRALERPHSLWCGWTAFDLAVEGECRDFVQTCCSQAVENRWTGDIDAQRLRNRWFNLSVEVVVFFNIFTLGIFAPWTLKYEIPPMSEELRKPAQLRSMPEGYPNRPQANKKLAARKEQWDKDREKTRENATEQKKAHDSTHNLLGSEWVRKIKKSFLTDLKKTQVPKDIKTMKKLAANPDLILTMSEDEISHLWDPTLTYVERWILFIKAPVTLFCWHAVVYTAVVMVFTYEIGKKYQTPPDYIPWSEFVVLVWAACSSVHEGSQMISENLMYFYDFWNAIDVLSITLFWTGFGLRVYCFDSSSDCRFRFLWDNAADSPSISELRLLDGEVFDEYVGEQLFKNEKGAQFDMFAQQVYGISCFFFWLRLLHLYSVNRVLGPLVLAIRRMLRDIFTFMFVWLVFLMAFATALNAGNTRGECKDPEDNEAIHGFCLPTWWIFRTYFQTFGEMFLDEMSDFISLSIFMLALLVLQLVLMNTVFVAIITSTFDKVWNDSTREWLIDMYKLINEYISFTAAIPVPLNVFAMLYNLFLFAANNSKVSSQQEKEKVAGLRVSKWTFLHSRLRNARYASLELLPTELQREVEDMEKERARSKAAAHGERGNLQSQASEVAGEPAERDGGRVKSGLSSQMVKHVEALMERAKAKYFQDKDSEADSKVAAQNRTIKVSNQVHELEKLHIKEGKVLHHTQAESLKTQKTLRGLEQRLEEQALATKKTEEQVARVLQLLESIQERVAPGSPRPQETRPA